MTIRLRRPQWVVSDDGWEFYSKDRFYMEYLENNNKYLIEVDRAPGSTGVYMSTLKPVNKNIILTEEHKIIIKDRIATAFEMMGVNVEFC